MDLQLWREFLNHPSAFCHPFADFSSVISSSDIGFYSDATPNAKLGFGAICGTHWMYHSWDESFILSQEPSIEFLELFAVTAGLMAWIHEYKNMSILIHCDNQSVVHMVNKTATSCPHCMTLIRIVVFQGLIHNVKINAVYVPGKINKISDFLSRMRVKDALVLMRDDCDKQPTHVSTKIWPIKKIWNV